MAGPGATSSKRRVTRGLKGLGVGSRRRSARTRPGGDPAAGNGAVAMISAVRTVARIKGRVVPMSTSDLLNRKERATIVVRLNRPAAVSIARPVLSG